MRFLTLNPGFAGVDLRLVNSEINGNKNIIFNLYGMMSFTSGLSDNLSLGTEINYPNDFLNFRLGYLQIGENFITGLGFVPRTNIRNFYGSFRLGPRLKMKEILQIKSGMTYSRL